MRIALDARAASHPQRGGFRTYTEQLMKLLPRVGPEHEYLFYLDRGVDATLCAESSNVTLKVIPHRMPGVGVVWREQVRLPRRLELDHARLAHFTSNTAPLRSPCPIVLTIHDTIAWSAPPPPKGLGLREAVKRWGMFLYNRYLSIASARRAVQIITVSEFSKKELVNRYGLPADHLAVTYEAPSASFCQLPREVAHEAVHNKFGLAQPYMLALSSADPRKNATGLLDAYSELEPDLIADYQLVVVWTHGLWKDRLAARVTNFKLTGRIVFLDQVGDSDLLNLYNAANVFVFPSLAEGFGLPPLEAMACGTPVLASNLSCLPEILGDAALMVDPRPQGQLARGMTIALRTPRLLEELSAKGSEWVRRYSWERCARETVQVYVEAIAKSAQRSNG